jgi:SAM-dependent methyltransferase
MIGTLPCLVPDPTYWKSLWRRRLDDYLDVTDMRIRFMEREAAQGDILPRTRARLLRVIEAKSSERTRIQELFVDLRAGSRQMSVVPAQPESLGARLAVLEWYEHVFRDWAWGEPESTRLAALVKRLAGRKIDFLAVYGAGAGRLAFDVHASLSPNHTLALDLNPLPLLIAERLIRGESLELDEFPVSPTTERCMVVRQRLEAPSIANEGLRFAFGDALEPPLRAGTVDAILTPWFVDSVPVDLRETLAIINRALRPGGHWIQIGPMNFNTVLSRTYLIEEVLELTERAGFRVQSHFEERVPYFDSPFSGSWREETLYCLAAEKVTEAPAFLPRAKVPPWVADSDLPIPVDSELIAMARTSAFTTMVMSLIDGTQSISDIAASLAERLGMDRDDLKGQLRAFFGKLPVP